MKRAFLLLSLLPLTALAQAPAPATPAPAPARPAPASPAAAKPATAGAPALTAAQQAQVQKQDAEMGAAALRAAQLVDANRAGELWDGASAVARRAVPKAAFVSQLSAERTRLGALAGRGQPTITRVKYSAGAAVPEGLYINVSFPTRFANSAQPVRELVSFRFDEDQVWRLAGYSLRASAP
ncbi:DUF4019 domain-containing protein [Stenotrophomonas maltophilia]|uniref:DUF4019 domain-containing protein n=1 Tax=Stenotrophomonas TaxID=40323 RepID=UPI0006C01C6E|nr:MULTISPECIES: DUF4019 domain-containing protein [Stenotrophomonas]KAA3598572.1 DUF4019 domain-containing protein [Stenotrophomonas maltophilia]KOO78331.1 hypothetical protein VO93_06980 [Stenotrophomonas maltophilia]MBN5124669.1 DUF4019 domain-containing protein [Stenotrophomonas maltophilia]MBN5175158.1 DUF4019 domain-containing protein [Stenotrophomonas maltophilia]MCU1120816.1 DUF4019 domain-containing protein [Stenotrophomonas maltophilia]